VEPRTVRSHGYPNGKKSTRRVKVTDRLTSQRERGSDSLAGMSHPADSSEWNNALQVVTRLAAAREAALQDVGAEQQRAAAADPRPRGIPAVTAARPVEPMDPDQLARAVAEIEQASAALRRSEPSLEVWQPDAPPRNETRQYLSVWILIGGIWISATLVVAGATGAILYLLG
jgi:hypothetical protein